MLRSTLYKLARHCYRLMPRAAQVKVRQAAGGPLLASRLRGTRPSDRDIDWVRSSKIPVSIVIPSYNDVPLLTACLESIDRTCGELDYEVIVVDDFCEALNRDKLRQLSGGRVRMVFREERGGFAKAVNTGIKEAKHDVVLLNSDIVAQPGWLEALQRAAHTEEGVGLVSPMLVYPDGLIQYGGTYYARRIAPQWFGHLFVGRRANDALANQPWFIRSISGACVYIRRDAVDSLVQLDEEFWLGFEDVDLGLRAWAAGFRCWYEPAAKLVHHESATRGYSQGQRELASMRYFWSKWSTMFLKRHFRAIPAVTFLSSSRSDPLWREYVDQLSAELIQSGVDSQVREVQEPVDEKLVAELEGSAAIVVASDYGATRSAWLATQQAGIPVYLLPGIEADSALLDESDTALVTAGYRPEFEYIPPNRHAEQRLAALSAWEARAVIAPALKPVFVGVGDHSGIVTVGVSRENRAAIEEAARKHGDEVLAHFDAHDISSATIAKIAGLLPKVIVSDVDYPHSLAPLALMSLGAAYIGRISAKNQYEVLDGYNSLLFAEGDVHAMLSSLSDVLSDDEVQSTVSANGFETAAAVHSASSGQLQRVLADVSGRAF